MVEGRVVAADGELRTIPLDYAWAYRYPTSPAEPPAPEVDEASALAHMILAELVKRLPSEVRDQAGT